MNRSLDKAGGERTTPSAQPLQSPRRQTSDRLPQGYSDYACLSATGRKVAGRGRTSGTRGEEGSGTDLSPYDSLTFLFGWFPPGLLSRSENAGIALCRPPGRPEKSSRTARDDDATGDRGEDRACPDRDELTDGPPPDEDATAFVRYPLGRGDVGCMIVMERTLMGLH